MRWLWQEILDQLNKGEMPPKKEKQPQTAELLAAVDAITESVGEAALRFKGTAAHTVLRRLNSYEYQQTIGDLLGLNVAGWNPTGGFPAGNARERLRQQCRCADDLRDVARSLLCRRRGGHPARDGVWRETGDEDLRAEVAVLLREKESRRPAEDLPDRPLPLDFGQGLRRSRRAVLPRRAHWIRAAGARRRTAERALHHPCPGRGD